MTTLLLLKLLDTLLCLALVAGVVAGTAVVMGVWAWVERDTKRST